MNRLLISAAFGIGVLALAPSSGWAAAHTYPGYGKALVHDLDARPRLAQAGKPDAGPGSPMAPKGGGDTSRGPRKGGGDASQGSRRGGDSRAFRRGDGDGRRDGRAWRGDRGPRHVGPPRHYYRPWSRRPYYGRVFGGIVLGTIIGVTVIGLVPPSPDPDLCWYWADPYRSRGYWDYCD